MDYRTLITSEELHGILDAPGLVVVDCRFSLSDTEQGRRAYAQDHLPGAFYAHLDEDLSGEIIQGETGRHPLPDIADLEVLFSKWGIKPESQVVVYDDMSGAIAARLWWLLRWLGHDRVAVLEGGYPAWAAAGYPVTDDLPASGGGSFRAAERPELLVDAAMVNEVRKDEHYRILDSRTAPRYRGEEEPIDPVAGHVPGAYNAPHPENVYPDGHWKSPAELAARFRTLTGTVPAESS